MVRVSGWIIVSGLLLAGLLNASTVIASEPFSRAHVDELAKMMAPDPTGLGRPCSDRAAWEAVGKHKEFANFVLSAEKLLSQPFPELPDDLFLDFSRTGNRERCQKVLGKRRGRIKTFVIAECIENKGRFVPALEEAIREICKEKTWVLPAHDSSLKNFRGEQITIDLGSANMASELALADYILADKLSPETRKLISTKVHERLLDPFHQMVLGKYKPARWLELKDNWNAVCLAGVAKASQSLVKDVNERAFFAAAVEHYSKFYLQSFTPDGYSSEGLSYWNYGFGHYAELCEAVRLATQGKLDLLHCDQAVLPAQFGTRIEIFNDVYPTFADCVMNDKPRESLVSYIDRRFGRKDDRAGKGYSRFTWGGLGRVLAYYPWEEQGKTAKTASDTKLNLRTWFEDAGVLICRPENTSGHPLLGMAMKGGHNGELHNHNDVGSFIVVVEDRQILADCGAEVYTKRTFGSRRYESKALNSFGHSVPVVAGKLQSTGKGARATILKTDFTDARDTLVLDMKAAYDVPELTRLVREFQYTRGNHTECVVTDRVSFSEPQSFEVAIITFSEWSQISPNTLQIGDDKQALEVQIRTEDAEFSITAETIDENLRVPEKPTRIAISLTKPQKNASIELQICPVDQQDTPKK